MIKKSCIGVLVIMFLCISLISVSAKAPGDDRNPTYTGKCVNAGNVRAIDTEKKLLIIDSLDYGTITLQVNQSSEIKIGNNFLNFEDIRKGDNVGFTGYWSGNLISANNIQVLEGAPSSYVALQQNGNTTDPNTGNSGQIIQPGHTSSATLAKLEIAKLIIRKGSAKINFRVRTYNAGNYDIKENFAIILYIRENSSAKYEVLKVWEEKFVKSQNYLSRDFFISDQSPYLQMNNFQVKAELVDGAGNIFYTFEQEYNGQDIN